MIERVWHEDFQEHILTLDGREVATAHRLVGSNWSVKRGAKFVGIAPNEATAIAALNKIAAQLA